MTRARAFEGVAALVLFALALYLVFESGSRGFFPLDQSNVFEGGYRMLRGQVPYRDFLMPVGPLAFLLQWPLFALLGVNNYAHLLHSGAVNAGAALLAVGCVKRLFPEALVPAYLAGLTTAAWFYPIFGTPAFDQTALFFHLIALACVLRSLGAPRPAAASANMLLGGFACGLAFFSKQNAGALSAAALALLVVGVGRGRRAALLARFAAGFLGCTALFSLWLLLFSDAPAFLRHFLKLPLVEGFRRASSAQFQAGVLHDLESGWGTLAIVVLGPALSLAGLAWHACVRALPPRAHAGFWVSLSLALVQWGFIRVTSNLPDNAFGFSGLASMLALLATLECLPAARPRLVAAALGALLALPLSVAGRSLARSRAVHEYWFPIHYRNAPVSRALAPARWSAPEDDARAIRVEDVDALVDFLRTRRAPFFVFPDFVALYGLVGTEPPQPLVWFHQGLTYPRDYDAALDRRVVDALERNRVRLLVFERVSFLGTEKRLAHFPLLAAYLGGFREVARFGIFEVRERP